jgi:hypothetical protein
MGRAREDAAPTCWAPLLATSSNRTIENLNVHLPIEHTPIEKIMNQKTR